METVRVLLLVKSNLEKKIYKYPSVIMLNFTQTTCSSSKEPSSEERHRKRNTAKTSGALTALLPNLLVCISSSLMANMPSWTLAYFPLGGRGRKAMKFILDLKLMSLITWWANDIITALKKEQQDYCKLCHFPFWFHTCSLPNQGGEMKSQRRKNTGGEEGASVASNR